MMTVLYSQLRKYGESQRPFPSCACGKPSTLELLSPDGYVYVCEDEIELASDPTTEVA